MTEWIKCEERMPEHEGFFNTYATLKNGNKVIGFHNYNLDFWTNIDGYSDRQLAIKITHWAELPEGPKDD